MILLIARGGDGIHCGRVGQNLALRNERRSSVLKQHQPRIQAPVFGEKSRQPVVQGRVDQPFDTPLGDIAQLIYSDSQKIKSQGQRLPVKITAADHFTAVGKDQRVIGS